MCMHILIITNGLRAKIIEAKRRYHAWIQAIEEKERDDDDDDDVRATIE